MANEPTNGVKAGIDAARGATTSVDGVPPTVLNEARQIALQTGGNSAAVSAFMTQQGFPQHAGEWCGDFAAAVVHASGGTPPPNSAAAGAWAGFGSPRQGAPQPGDVAVMRGNDARTGYPYTHVTFVDSVNPDGTFVGLGGNQRGGLRSTFSTAGFDFRNPAGPAPSYSFTLPKNAPMGMGNNNPLNIKYYKGAEKDYPGLIGPSANTDQGDPQMKFGTPEAGWNAAYSLLQKKYGEGMTTPNAIIAGKSGWTPGNTQAAANVAKAAGIGPNDDISFSDPAKAQRFMRALVTQEQGGAGSAYPDAMIANAISGKATPAATAAAPVTYGTTLNTAGGPTAVAGGPSAPAAPGQPGQAQGGLAGSLPGFTTNSPGAQMTAAGLKQLAGGSSGIFGGGGGGGGGGDEDKPPPPSPMIGAPPMASGGPMMLGEGGQNTFGQRAAMNALAQQGFLMQPSLAAYTMGGLNPPVPSTIQSQPAGQAAGVPGLPGTTLNSPSQLQMALMTGAMNPYDLYASGAYGGAQGIGSM